MNLDEVISELELVKEKRIREADEFDKIGQYGLASMCRGQELGLLEAIKVVKELQEQYGD